MVAFTSDQLRFTAGYPAQAKLNRVNEADKQRYAGLMTEESEKLGREKFGNTSPLVTIFAMVIKTPDLFKEAARRAKARFDKGEAAPEQYTRTFNKR